MQRTRATFRTARVRRARTRAACATGFTLVEMLVATALVALMMVLFAEIFSQAIGTMSAQRALANNDQKARTFTDTLRNDFQRMTFRTPPLNAGSAVDIEICQGATRVINTPASSGRGLLPLGAGDVVDPRQRGYFCFSENDFNHDGDDVLQFTVELGETLRHPTVSNPNHTLYVGRALPLGPAHPNQPDGDDGLFNNGVTASRAAEVTYFLRGGNLYRRVMLLRDPLPSAAPPFGTQPSQGQSGTGGPFGAFTQIYPGSFYHDFDPSGTRLYREDTNTNSMQDPETAGDSYYFRFHGLAALDNTLGLSSHPLANPGMRFGFHPEFGLPREYLNRNDQLGVSYLGRFTHQETSHPLFRWPGLEEGLNVNVLLREDLTFTGDVATHPTGPTVLEGDRVGEDLLLPNVDAFNVEVWDPEYREGNLIVSGGSLTQTWTAFDPEFDYNGNGIWETNGAFVSLGHGAHYHRTDLDAMGNPITVVAYPGRFHHYRNQNPGYGGRNYDPAALTRGVDGEPGVAGVDDNDDGVTDDLGELGWPGTDDVYNRIFDTWHPQLSGTPPFRSLAANTPDIVRWFPGQAYTAGQTYWPDFLGYDRAPGVAGVDDDGNGTTDFFPPAMPGQLPTPDFAEVGFAGSDDILSPSLGYRVIFAPGGATSGAREPEWPRAPGAIVQDGGLTWQCYDNRLGLEMIRVTIRFRDQASGRPRQVTLVHSFVE